MVEQAGITGLEAQRGTEMFPDQPAFVNTRLPTVLDKHSTLIPDLPPLPSANHCAPPSCNVHVCRAHDVVVWRDHLPLISPIFDLHQIPFISDEPFPILDDFPPPLDAVKPEPTSPIPLPSLLAISCVFSYVTRTFITLSVWDPSTWTVDSSPVKPSFHLEEAMFWYNQTRDGMCKVVDQLAVPEIAHANPKLLPVLQQMADYMRRALERVLGIAKEESYY